MNSSGLWQCREGAGEAKQYSLANAARSGLMSAFLAQSEAKAPIDMIEGTMGFLKGYTGKIDFQELIIDKNIHAIDEVSNKPWPACRHSHPVIGVSLDIKKEIKEKKYSIDDIEKITQDNFGQRSIEAEKALNMIVIESQAAIKELDKKFLKDNINKHLAEFLDSLSEEEISRFKKAEDLKQMITNLATIKSENNKTTRIAELESLDSHVIESMFKRYIDNA